VQRPARLRRRSDPEPSSSRLEGTRSHLQRAPHDQQPVSPYARESRADRIAAAAGTSCSCTATVPVGDELARNEIARRAGRAAAARRAGRRDRRMDGLHDQQSLQNALERAGVQRSVVTMITQTLCHADDPDLRTPSKPVGHNSMRRERRGSWHAAFRARRPATRSHPRPSDRGEPDGAPIFSGGIHRHRRRRWGTPVFRDPSWGSKGSMRWPTRIGCGDSRREIGAQVLLILRM